MKETGKISEALQKAVKKDSPSRPWPVYRDYEITEEDGEAFVVAPIGLFEEVAEGSWQGRSPEDAALSVYAPLRTPELIVDLAERADEPITPDAVVGWAECYGLLASSRSEDVLEQPGLMGRERVSGFGCRERVSGFAKAAKEVSTCLRAYEVLRRNQHLDLEKLFSDTDPLPQDALRPWERKQGHERAWLFGVLGRMVQTRLHEHCYPQFNCYTRGGYPTGRFELSWGFHNLLGAIWIQMAWLLESESNRVKFCKLPDCRRVVSFASGEPLDTDPDAEAHGKRKIRKDRVFCKPPRGCKQNYDYRRRAGWEGYS